MFTLAIIYLSLPVFLVLFTFFSITFVMLSAFALAVLIFYLYNTHKDSSSHFNLRMLRDYWPLLLFSVVVTYLCVVSPFKIWDWEKHFTVLNTLVEYSWPPVVNVHEQTWFLRYYLAWYVVPALFTKIFGSQLLTVFMFIWTATGVFTALFLAFKGLCRVSHLFIAVTVFFIFSGLDIIGAWLNGNIPNLYPHWPQIWAGWGEIWPALTGLAWTPQHVIGGWVAACMFLFNRNLAIKYGAVIIALTALWSPFCAIGLIPIAIWAVFKDGYKTAITPQNLLAAPLIALCVGMYLSQGASQVPFMFVWEHEKFSIISFMLFIVFEFLLAIVILYLSRKTDRSLIITLGVFLTALCLVRFGVLNDLLMRGAIPAICIMSVLLVKALLESRKWEKEVIVSYLLVGAFPVVFAFAKGHSTSMGKTDAKMNFKKLTTLYTYEKHPEMTYAYLVEIRNGTKFFGVPLLRNLH